MPGRLAPLIAALPIEAFVLIARPLGGGLAALLPAASE
jgi:hypothetical protein